MPGKEWLCLTARAISVACIKSPGRSVQSTGGLGFHPEEGEHLPHKPATQRQASRVFSLLEWFQLSSFGGREKREVAGGVMFEGKSGEAWHAALAADSLAAEIS